MSSMRKREHKLLMLDFQQLNSTDAAYVHRHIVDHISLEVSATLNPEIERVIFCLETVRLNNPLLFKIRTWIDEVVGDNHSDTAAFLAKSCRVCNSHDTPKKCATCKRVYYCGKSCQTLDWKRHKTTCRPCVQD